jgi:hypothetical protein
MALTTTTNSSAIAATDQSFVVASATSFSAGKIVKVNGEFMQVLSSYTSGTTIPVRRGLNGTQPQAHGATSNGSVGDGSDFAQAAPQGTMAYPGIRVREVKAYGAAGAITLPTPGNDAVAILNGTNALAMTLANPTKDQDGDILIVTGNGKAAHTVTYTAGVGNGGSGYDVFTFATGANNTVAFIAANAIWNPLPSLIAGTATAISATIA